MTEALFLDVNIPMYAGGSEHPLREPCAWILGEIAEGRMSVATDAEVFQELLYRYGALRLWQIGVRMATALFGLLPVILPITVEDVRAAVDVFGRYGPQGIPARDCLHAGVMSNHGLSHILSTDRHFDQIEGITRVDPEQLYQQQAG